MEVGDMFSRELIRNLVSFAVEFQPRWLLNRTKLPQSELFEIGFDVVAEIGRVKSGNTGKNGGKGDTWGYTKTSMFRVTGRHILNVWRLMRGELALNHYSMENIAYELLRTRWVSVVGTSLYLRFQIMTFRLVPFPEFLNSLINLWRNGSRLRALLALQGLLITTLVRWRRC